MDEVYLNLAYQAPSFTRLSSPVFAFVPCCCTCCVFTSSAYRSCFITSLSPRSKPAGIWMRSGWQGMCCWLICSAWGYDENSHLCVYMNTVISVWRTSVVVNGGGCSVMCWWTGYSNLEIINAFTSGLPSPIMQKRALSVHNVLIAIQIEDWQLLISAKVLAVAICKWKCQYSVPDPFLPDLR